MAARTAGSKATRLQRARRANITPGSSLPGGLLRLYALARLLQKHARLFAVLESLDNGKPIREARDIDIPLAQRHFYYHAGLAQLLAEELPDHAPSASAARSSRGTSRS
jgi:acyl-CoA reductase-like NAD-dependent aldehyde dehydrogenase